MVRFTQCSVREIIAERGTAGVELGVSARVLGRPEYAVGSVEIVARWAGE